MTNDRLPCGIPRAQHPVCWEKRCYLSGEGCPVHQGPKKHIIRKLPEYVFDTILIDGVRIHVGKNALFPNSEN